MKTYKIMIRQVDVVELGRLQADPETLDNHVQEVLRDATEKGLLGRLATRVGLPAVAVSEVQEGSIAGDNEEIVSIALYDPAGTPLASRIFTVEPKSGGFLCHGEDGDRKQVLGIFTTESLAQQVGALWRNGHIIL